MNVAKRMYRPRILLVEDEALVGMDMALTLQTEGYEVLGPCRTVEEAKDVVARLFPDAALLDIKLGENSTSFEVIDLLNDADIPFAFVTGYSAKTVPLPEGAADRPRMSKPVEPGALRAVLDMMIDEPADAGDDAM